jgi:hypothetical protein
MSSKKITLELTEFQAKVLTTLTMESVLWYESGRFGKAAENIYGKLSGPNGESNYKPKEPLEEEHRTWRRGRKS